MHRRTKIICTIGPAVDSFEKMLELIDAGMNVARLNFSHGTHAEHQTRIDLLKKAREMKKKPLAIMLDTKGPEIRVGQIKDPITLQEKQKLKLRKDVSDGNASGISINPSHVIDQLRVGMTVLFDDGYISAKVVEVSPGEAVVEIQNPGVLKSQKGVNLPHCDVELPAMTEQDKLDIAFGCRSDVDLIAASFIRSPEHVLEIKQLLVQNGKPNTLILAKIENHLGVQNFDSILQVADGIMVARGDLGVELPLEQVPTLQKMMIRKCYNESKLVVTATQMLESMIKNPRPTRAEVSDVANAIYDSTSAVMLSGETAVGSYPIQTVEMMRRIIEEAERDFDYRDFFLKNSRIDYSDVSTAVALATVKTAYSTQASAIFAYTQSGITAHLISRFRPHIPIVAMTATNKVYNQLACVWGVIPVPPESPSSVQESIARFSTYALEHKLVQYGDTIVATAGTPFGVRGTTNSLIVETIGDVLVRTQPGVGERVRGKVAIVLSSDGDEKRVAGQIIVIPRCDPSFANLFASALAVILQNHQEDSESESSALALAKKYGKPIVVRADKALHLLKDGQQITLDPAKGLVYNGTVS